MAGLSLSYILQRSYRRFCQRVAIFHSLSISPEFSQIISSDRGRTSESIAYGCDDEMFVPLVILFHWCVSCWFADAKGLVSVDSVERLREKVYAALDEYCRRGHPEEPGRFAKLLLRLPALRSIGLKCIEHLFFYKLVSDSHFDSFLIEMLDIPAATTESPSVAEQPAEYVWPRTWQELFRRVVNRNPDSWKWI